MGSPTSPAFDRAFWPGLGLASRANESRSGLGTTTPEPGFGSVYGLAAGAALGFVPAPPMAVGAIGRGHGAEGSVTSGNRRFPLRRKPRFRRS
jgi:hypothetical protein